MTAMAALVALKVGEPRTSAPAGSAHGNESDLDFAGGLPLATSAADLL